MPVLYGHLLDTTGDYLRNPQRPKRHELDLTPSISGTCRLWRHYVLVGFVVSGEAMLRVRRGVRREACGAMLRVRWAWIFRLIA
jgi:hypothetical protein